MTKKERVLCAINHKISDKLPKGELGIARETADGILGRKLAQREREVAVRERLGIDLIALGSWGINTEIGRDPSGNPIYRNAYGYDYIAGKHDKKLIRPSVADPEVVKEFRAPTLQCVDLSEMEDFSKKRTCSFLPPHTAPSASFTTRSALKTTWCTLC